MAKQKKCPDCAEMVLADARKCRFCGHEFAQPSAPPKTANDGKTGPGCVVLGILGLVLLYGIGKCAGPENTENSTSSATEQALASEAQKEPYAVRLQREVDALKATPRLKELPTDKNSLLMSAVLIGARIKLYRDVPSKLTPEDEKIRKEFRRLQAAYQRDAFPKLRKAQAKVLNDSLWEQNVSVAATGGRNEALRLTGGIFASNKAIGISQNAISDSLEIFRFKRAMYEWYRGSEYQYYDMKPLPDGELADFTSANRWVAIN